MKNQNQSKASAAGAATKTAITVRTVKQGNATLANPIYKVKPYIVLTPDGIVGFAGTLSQVAALSEYHDDWAVEVRTHDLDANDNTRISPTQPGKATARPLQKWSELNDGQRQEAIRVCAANGHPNCVGFGFRFDGNKCVALVDVLTKDNRPIQISRAEHSALLAIAEAAQYRYASLDAQEILNRLAVNANVPDEDRRKAARAAEQLFKTTNLIDRELANLAAVRGESSHRLD